MRFRRAGIFMGGEKTNTDVSEYERAFASARRVTDIRIAASAAAALAAAAAAEVSAPAAAELSASSHSQSTLSVSQSSS
jgi:hypothetical protein